MLGQRVGDIQIQRKAGRYVRGLIKLGHTFAQDRVQLRRVDRLQQIIHCPVADRALGIFEIVITADHDHLDFRITGMQLIHQHHSVGAGHTHISNDELRGQLTGQPQCFTAILRFTGNLQPELLPRPEGAHNIPVPAFVIYQQHFIHPLHRPLQMELLR
ncbi:hypothetical protein D3C75_1019240 [compost metagenome]